MHDGLQYDTIQGQGHEPLKAEILPFLKTVSSPIYHGSWQMTRILNQGTITKAYQSQIFQFCPSFCVTRRWQ